MEKCVKLPRFSTHNGNSPDSRLFSRYKYCRLEMSPSSDGIDPVRSLPLRLNPTRLDRFPSSFGIDPVSLLVARFSVVRLRFPSSFGIDPVSLWLMMTSIESSDKLPSSGGSVPSNGVPPTRVLEIVVTR